MTLPKTTGKLLFCGGSKASSIACLALGAIVLARLSAYSPVSFADSLPDWLAAANKVDLAHFGEGTPAVIVSDWTDFTVDASGKFILTERRAIRVLNRRSAEPYLIARGYEDNSTKVESIQSWTIAPSGHVMQAGKKDVISKEDYPEYALFGDQRLKMINPPGAEAGSLVGYEIVTQGRDLIDGDTFSMENEIPIRQSELHVKVPSGSIRWFINHPDRVEVVNQSPQEASFRSMNRPGVSYEPNAPPFRSVAAHVVVNFDPKGPSAVQSWEDAGRIDHEFYTDSEKPGPEISSRVEALIAGKSDDVSKIDALYTFVSRQIRYVAVEVGIGGFKPHAAIDVFQNSYGDCKDKANLLITMLGHAGLRGFPASVGTRGDVKADPNTPTLANFDHVIVALPVPESLRPAVEKFPAYDKQSRILWIDPTSEADPLGQVPEMDQGVFALITYADHGDLRRIPETTPEYNGTHYTAHVRLQPDGNGVADVQVEYSGAYNTDKHYFYRGLSQDEIRRQFENRVARYASEASFQKASISGIDDSRQAIVENFSFMADFSVASTGDSWFLQPLFLSGMAVPELGPKPRRLPLDIGTPERITGEYRIELPTGMRVDRLPDKSSLKSEFGELDVEYSASENVVIATQTLTFTQSRISPEKYPEFRDFVNASLRAERQMVHVVRISP